MELKYTVEIEVPDEKLKQLKGLTIDALVSSRIETALFPVCGAAILVYPAEKGKSPIDLFQKCPACGHPWGKHFDQVVSEVVRIPDGKSLVGKEEGLATVVKGTLTDPVPTTCGECVALGKSCEEALKYK